MPDEGQLHLDYGTALHNASIAMDHGRGAVRFVVRRSQERARLRHEALAEIDRAIHLAHDDDNRAYAYFARARLVEVMGYPLSAIEYIELARRLRPGEQVLEAMRSRLMARLWSGDTIGGGEDHP